MQNVSVVINNVSDKYNISYTIPALLGQYNITFIANDTFNNLNITETTFFVGVDNIPPTFTNVSCVPNPTGINSTIDCNATITDNLAVGSIFANVTLPNSSVLVQGVSNVGENYTFRFNTTEEVGIYNVLWVANDSKGNSANATSSFEIMNPIIVILGCAPNPANISQSVECLTNITTGTSQSLDSVLANITLPNGTVLFPSVTNVSSIYNVTFSNTNLVGFYNVTWFANDSVGSISVKNESFRVIEFTKPSIFGLIPIANSTFNVSQTIEIAANATDDTEIASVSANITLPNGTVTQLILSNVSVVTNTSSDKYNASFLIPTVSGQYNITFIATDTSDNVNSSETTFFNTVSSFSVGNIQCSNDTANYFGCDTLSYGTNITHIRATCTNLAANIDEVRFTLFNEEDNVNYVNNVSSTFNVSEIFTYNSSFVLQDSGNWTLSVSCSSGGNLESSAVNFSLPFGNISIALLDPLADMSVLLNEFFTFSANVTCVGGECGVVNVTLDPEEVICSEVETCENVSNMNCINETTKSCETVCNNQTVIDCTSTIDEICIDVCIEYETINGTSGDCLSYAPQCDNVTSEICNETVTEVCEKINCTKEVVENCTEIIEESCTVEEVCTTIEFDEESSVEMGSIEIILNSSIGDAKIVLDQNVTVLNKELIITGELGLGISTASVEDKEFTYRTPILAVELENDTGAMVTLPKYLEDDLEVIIKCDDWNFTGERCSSEWYVYATVDELEQNIDSVTFAADSFSAYAGGDVTGGDTAFLIIWDENDIGMPNSVADTTSVRIVNENATFYADYKIATNATSISDGTCTIDINGTSNNMIYSSGYYNYVRNMTVEGAYGYTISCTSNTYTDLNASDSIVIGKLSNETKGAISTIVGDIPFYTTSNNPFVTSNLYGGGNEVVSWNVNATGVLNKVYDFFIELIGTYVPLTNSTHVNIGITANDTTSPVFISRTISPAAVINGSSAIINADVSDNIQVDEVWANVTLPDNSTEVITAGSLPYNFTNTSLIGIYNVTFYANDTSGNNATTTKTFEVALPLNLTMNVSVDVNVSVNVSTNVNFIAYVAGTKDIIEERLNITGSESVQLPNVPVDLFFDATFNNSNLLTTLFEINLSDNENTSVTFGNPTVAGFLVTYGIETDFNFTNAQSEFSYSGTSFTIESNLQLHKCDNFAIGSGTCVGGFNDITSSAQQDTVNDKFIYNTTSFSGFGIVEFTATTTPESDSEGEGGGGGALVILAKEEVEAVEALPEQLFDITFNLDDTTIQNIGELSGILTFESFGTVPTPVDLTFTILDAAGREVYREKGNITVTTEEILRWNYEERGLGALVDGKYVAVLTTLYNVDVKDEFRIEFEIGTEKGFFSLITGNAIKWIGGNGKWWLTGIAGIILVIGLAWWLIVMRKGSEGMKG